jgi:exonuclease SbcC
MSSRFITQVVLENFQDHEHTVIDFVNGINLVVGSSDAGKSAILRAINFVFHNNLKGESFIRHGSTECKVSVKFSDGVEVCRIKGGDTNSYILTDIDNNKHSFSKIGTSVPDEIKKQLGQPPLDDKKRPISYADQMSNLFLVDLSPTDLPRTLSELTGIQNLQMAAENLSKNARSYDRIIKDKNDKIEKLEKDLDNYSYVVKDLEAIESIEKSLETINKNVEKTKKARNFIISNNKISVEAKSVKKQIDTDKKLFELDKNFKEAEKLHTQLVNSKRILKSYKTVAEEFNGLKKEIISLKLFASEDNKSKIDVLSNCIDLNTSADTYQIKFKNLSNEKNSLVQSISKEEKIIAENKDELKKLIDELKLKGNWCESCNRPLV